MQEIADFCRSRGVLYHCDAVQAAGKVEIDVSRDHGIQADYLSLTGHKFHAPKGVGALYVRRKAPFSALILGGHQERNLRGGTECVPLIVGMGKAAELARKQLPGYEKKVRPLRDALEDGQKSRSWRPAELLFKMSTQHDAPARRPIDDVLFDEKPASDAEDVLGHKPKFIADTKA